MALPMHKVCLAGSGMMPGSIPRQSQKSPNHQYLFLTHDIARVCMLFPGGEQLQACAVSAPKATTFLEVQPHVCLGASLGHKSSLLL